MSLRLNESPALQVFSQALAWAKDSHPLRLFTVIETWGSSPRPVGSVMALRDDGAVVGSVSGGCIEDYLIRHHRGAAIEGGPRKLLFGEKQLDTGGLNLPCGATLAVWSESISLETLIQIVQALEDGQCATRSINTRTAATDLLLDVDKQKDSYQDSILRVSYGPGYSAVLIGAGQLSAYLAQILLTLDFKVTVCDPRESYAAEWSVAGTTLKQQLPDDLFQLEPIDANTAVVALSHDPKLDDLALIAALDSPAFYVGALGSVRSQKKRRIYLKEFGLSVAQLDQLDGPAGVEIGSRTPAEIAVSVAAAMIKAMKNQDV